MLVDSDEGFGPSPIPINENRQDFPTFMPEIDDSEVDYTRIFPSKLDLSNVRNLNSAARNSWNGSERSRRGIPKVSPIKENQEVELYSENSKTMQSESPSKRKIKKKTIKKSVNESVPDFKHSIDQMFAEFINPKKNGSLGSLTSDKGSSISSSGSSSRYGSQRSLTREVIRSNKLINRFDTRKLSDDVDDVFADSDFQFSDGSTTPTRIHEIARNEKKHHESWRFGGGEEEEERLMSQGKRGADIRNIATNTTTCPSDSVLYRIYEDREKKKTFEKSTIQQLEISEQETPILRSQRVSEFDFASPIECVRNEHGSRTIGHITGNFGGANQVTHSLSGLTLNESPPKRLKGTVFNATSLPNLPRFEVPRSARDIYTPLDIDEIFGKGVRKDPKSTEKHFGGKEVAKNIHGSAKPAWTRRIGSDEGRIVGRRNLSQPPPFCSATHVTSKGVSYSIGSVGQELLGTVKSLHPDWMPLIHKILRQKDDVDMLDMFVNELRQWKERVEEKWQRNYSLPSSRQLETDDYKTRMADITRILKRIDTLRSPNCSRVQQLKIIQKALLSA